MASRFGVNGVPALFFYRNGVLIEQVPGAIPKPEIERRLKGLMT